MKQGNFILKHILILFLFLLVFNLQGQVIDADTTRTINPTIEEAIHSPKKATLYSAILPGLGQAYNKKAWKIPFIYGGFGAIGYFIRWNNNNYQLNRVAYDHLTDTDPLTTDYLKIEAVKYYDLDNATSLSNFKEGLTKRQDYYRRNRDLLIISMLGFYGLNIIDASVDAHLFNFDISDDLSLFFEPSMINFQDQNIYCINCKLNF